MLLSLLLLAAATLPAQAASRFLVRTDHWSEADERGFGDFIAAIGNSGCDGVDSCLKSAANPFRASDSPDAEFRADCADLPYVLRFYYAWKRGLPFSYVSEVAPRGRARDIRYSEAGNTVERRWTVPSGAEALAVLARLQDDISSASYRIDPEREAPLQQDFYSPALDPRFIRAGTVIYDPNGHLALIFRIEPDGRIRYIDAHPDNSLTRGFYDRRFVRAAPGMGAGFKNWRPQMLLGARRVDGVLFGGSVVLAPNQTLPGFSLTQYYGTGQREDRWKAGVFRLGDVRMDYYDYIRASLSGGRLTFEPIREITDMVASNCADLGYRAEAVEAALEAHLQYRPQPERLPFNIYGSDGEWETYSTPSRDARLKTAFVNLRQTAERFITMARSGDPRLLWRGGNLATALLTAYDGAAAGCRVSYIRSDGARITFSYEEARARLFRLSFDPYACVEHRWGALGAEAASCRDGAVKQAWYEAEQRLRNQIERTYDAEMDFSLRDLQRGEGGVATPPDADTRGYLLSLLREER
ncbi:MAG: hypothetical protein JO256_07715 [Alphaproteobacteria bacterium]|nr:hypothetical protein [Alphaproteobacteria bacterium]